MDVDEITVPSPDFPGGQTFGPVTLETVWEGSVDFSHELPVLMTPRRGDFLGIRWYPEVWRTRGVFTVTGDQIRLRPTAPLVIVPAAWWRRAGYWLLGHRRRARPFKDHPRLPTEP